MTLLDDTNAAIERLRQMQRRKGIVSAQTLLAALPPRVRADLSTWEAQKAADAINQTLSDEADPVGTLAVDHQARAAGAG